jgi:hypothetical protein
LHTDWHVRTINHAPDKARTTRALQDRSPKRRARARDVLQSNEMIRHGPDGQKLEMQNSTCVERQKEARICIGMQDGIPDDQRSR